MYHPLNYVDSQGIKDRGNRLCSGLAAEILGRQLERKGTVLQGCAGRQVVCLGAKQDLGGQRVAQALGEQEARVANHTGGLPEQPLVEKIGRGRIEGGHGEIADMRDLACVLRRGQVGDGGGWTVAGGEQDLFAQRPRRVGSGRPALDEAGPQIGKAFVEGGGLAGSAKAREGALDGMGVLMRHDVEGGPQGQGALTVSIAKQQPFAVKEGQVAALTGVGDGQDAVAAPIKANVAMLTSKVVPQGGHVGMDIDSHPSGGATAIPGHGIGALDGLAGKLHGGLDAGGALIAAGRIDQAVLITALGDREGVGRAAGTDAGALGGLGDIEVGHEIFDEEKLARAGTGTDKERGMQGECTALAKDLDAIGKLKPIVTREPEEGRLLDGQAGRWEAGPDGRERQAVGVLTGGLAGLLGGQKRPGIEAVGGIEIDTRQRDLDAHKPAFFIDMGDEPGAGERDIQVLDLVEKMALALGIEDLLLQRQGVGGVQSKGGAMAQQELAQVAAEGRRSGRRDGHGDRSQEGQRGRREQGLGIGRGSKDAGPWHRPHRLRERADDKRPLGAGERTERLVLVALAHGLGDRGAAIASGQTSEDGPAAEAEPAERAGREEGTRHAQDVAGNMPGERWHAPRSLRDGTTAPRTRNSLSAVPPGGQESVRAADEDADRCAAGHKLHARQAVPANIGNKLCAVLSSHWLELRSHDL